MLLWTSTFQAMVEVVSLNKTGIDRSTGVGTTVKVTFLNDIKPDIPVPTSKPYSYTDQHTKVVLPTIAYTFDVASSADCRE